MLKATPDFILKYTNEQGEDVTESIECKNLFYGDDGKTAHEDGQCRPCYVLQTTMQMQALGCKEALLISSGPRATCIFPITFDHGLWGMMSAWSKRWYEKDLMPSKQEQLAIDIIARAKDIAQYSTAVAGLQQSTLFQRLYLKWDRKSVTSVSAYL